MILVVKHVCIVLCKLCLLHTSGFPISVNNNDDNCDM